MQDKYRSKLSKLEEKVRVLEGARTAADEKAMEKKLFEAKNRIEKDLQESYLLKLDR
jgi:exonuclease VII small subunit